MSMLSWEGLKKLGRRPRSTTADSSATPATKCERCGEMCLKKTMEEALSVCPACNFHRRIGARRRIEITIDDHEFTELWPELGTIDILEFRGLKSYTDKLREAQKATGLRDAMIAGLGKLHTRDVAIGATDSGFIAGSMGSALGEKFTRLTELALEKRIPLIVISGSGGGARMYEGLFSLMQMAKTSSALGRLRAAGVPFISVVTDETMAGVWASWAALGDLILAEPGAQVGFTGPRVIETTINCELPEGFQLSEFLLEHGQIDQIVHRHHMRERIGQFLELMCGPVPGHSVFQVMNN